MLRSDLVTRTRDYLNEAVADIFTDAQLQRYYNEEIRSLPSKAIYKEGLHTFSTSPTQADPKAYTLTTGVFKVERVERNDGNTTTAQWNEINGCDNYNGILYLPYTPGIVESMRYFSQDYFAVVTDDNTAIDVPDDKSEIVVWGMVIRGYKQAIGYLRNSRSWDSVTKPGDLSIPVLQNWLRDAEKYYKELIQQYATSPRVRSISLVD